MASGPLLGGLKKKLKFFRQTKHAHSVGPSARRWPRPSRRRLALRLGVPTHRAPRAPACPARPVRPTSARSGQPVPAAAAAAEPRPR